MFNFINKKQKKTASDEQSGMTANSADGQQYREKLIQGDPTVRINLAGNQIYPILASAIKTIDGTEKPRVENVLCALGSLAGYACQAGIRKKFIENAGMPEANVFVTLGTKNGETYYTGDYINELLLESKASVWNIINVIEKDRGVTESIDPIEIVEHTIKTMGSDRFGVLRVPEDHLPSWTPQKYVEYNWPVFLHMLEMYTDDPTEWPLMYTSAILIALREFEHTIDAKTALTIVMESAISSSRISLKPVTPK